MERSWQWGKKEPAYKAKCSLRRFMLGCGILAEDTI